MIHRPRFATNWPGPKVRDVVRHLLVTNDFPPKVGGIQNYLWELWRRLPADDAVVYTTPHPQAEAFDAEQKFSVLRSRERWLLPRPGLVRRINRLVDELAIDLVVLDPAVPVGLIGPHLRRPYAVVLHGAEVTIPGRLPVTRRLLNRVLSGSVGVIAAGGYPAQEAQRSLGRPLPPCTVIPPGVDGQRFVPQPAEAIASTRHRLGLPEDSPVVVSVSRLVPRKGMDVLIDAAGLLGARHSGLVVAIAGSGRDTRRLQRRIDRTGAPVQLLGRLSEADLVDLYAAGQVFAMLCRSRWAGLEQEGFGIVFLEAAASGVPQVAGRSGGAHEAVADGHTGLIVDDPKDPVQVAEAIDRILTDPQRGQAMGSAARERAVSQFGYDQLAEQLHAALETMAGANP